MQSHFWFVGVGHFSSYSSVLMTPILLLHVVSLSGNQCKSIYVHFTHNRCGKIMSNCPTNIAYQLHSELTHAHCHSPFRCPQWTAANKRNSRKICSIRPTVARKAKTGCFQWCLPIKTKTSKGCLKDSKSYFQDGNFAVLDHIFDSKIILQKYGLSQIFKIYVKQ